MPGEAERVRKTLGNRDVVWEAPLDTWTGIGTSVSRQEGVERGFHRRTPRRGETTVCMRGSRAGSNHCPLHSRTGPTHPFPRKVVDTSLDRSARHEPSFYDQGQFRRVLDGMHQLNLSARAPVPWTPAKSYDTSPSLSCTCGKARRSSQTPSASRSANCACTSARPFRLTAPPNGAPMPRCDAPVIPLDSMCCASRNPNTRLLAREYSRMWWYRSAAGADALLQTRCRTTTQ